jgi:cell division protein FtsQ
MPRVRSRGAVSRRRSFASLFFLGFGRGNRRLGQKKQAEPTRSAKPAVPLWQRSLRRLRQVLILALVVGGLIAAVGGGRYFVYHSPRLALREVRITGTRHLQQATILSRAAVTLGTNLLHVDSDAIVARLASEPWLKQVRVRRELPNILHIELIEHEPAALVSLESVYLCDSDGLVFKRAHPSEYGDLAVITGIGRAGYVLEPTYARTQIRTALLGLQRYALEPGRPPIGEVHIDRFVGLTLYTRAGMALQLGQGQPEELDARLARFDTLWRKISRSDPMPQMVYLNNRAHPDHLTVRYAGGDAMSRAH